MDAKKHYATLDGLRGVAALAVMLYHFTGWTQSPVQHGYLAVDFFFALSGFVVADAYERRLATGSLTVAAFIKTRVIRLWPMMILGAILGTAALYAKSVNLGGVDRGLLLPMLIAGVFMFPLALRQPTLSDAYPINPPAWSLMYEVLINVAYAVLGPRLNTRTLVGIALAAAGGLIALGVSSRDLSLGHSLQQAPWGICRVIFSFTVGVLLWRLKPAVRLPLPVILGVLALVLWAPTGSASWLHDLASILVAFPILIAAGANHEPRHPGLHLFVGRVSYPLYALHYPFLPIFQHVARGRGWEISYAPLVLAEVVMMTLAAWLALRFYDEPIRRRLTDLTRKPVAPIAGQSDRREPAE